MEVAKHVEQINLERMSFNAKRKTVKITSILYMIPVLIVHHLKLPAKTQIIKISLPEVLIKVLIKVPLVNCYAKVQNVEKEKKF